MKKLWISLVSMLTLSIVCIYIQPEQKTVESDSKKQKTIQTIFTGTSSIGAPEGSQGRNEWQLLRLKDPKTGNLPRGIRRSELEFAKKHLRKTAINNKSSNWLDRGPFNVGGRTRAVALDVRDENTIWAGAVSGGIWRSNDAGDSWKRITPSTQIQNVTTFVQDTRSGKEDTWYYGTGEAIGNSASGAGAFYLGNGIYKTTDNGATWQSLNSTASTPVNSFDSEWDLVYRLALDVNDTTKDVIYAATLGSIQRSEDGGQSWTRVLGETPRTTAQVTDVLTTSEGTVYATLSSSINNDNGIWRSEDGVNWTNITAPNFASVYNRIVMAVNPSNENELYFLGNTPGSGTASRDFFNEEEYNSLWKYTYLSGDGTDSGGVWTDLSSSIPNGKESNFDNFYAQGSYNMMIKVSPTDSNAVIIGGTNLYISTDGFRSDSNVTIIGGYEPGTKFPDFQIYPNHHPDNHDVVFLPSNPNVLISASDGGVRRTENMYADTVVWDNLNRGYQGQQLYTIGFNPSTTDDILVGGFQDNGNFYTNSEDPRAEWVLPVNGDGSYMGIADTGNLYYLSIQRGKIFKGKLNNEGEVESFRRIDPLQANRDDYLFINPLVLDPNDNDLMYVAGGTKVWRNDDLSNIPMTNEWDTISQGWSSYSDTVTSIVSAISVSKKPANILYYGTSEGQLFKVENAHIGDPTHQEITEKRIPRVTNGFPNAYINSIAIDPRDADKVLIAFSNYRVYSLYYTEDGGSNWMKVAGNLEANAIGSGDGPSCRSVSILPLSDDSTMFLVGTSTGLYTTDTLIDENTTWKQVEVDRIGNAVVEMVQTRTTDGLIAVATHGNGIYTTKVFADYTVQSISPVTCNENYISPSGKILNKTGNYIDTIANSSGGDSIIYIDLTLFQADTGLTQSGFTLESEEPYADSYQWLNCTDNSLINGANSRSFSIIENGSYSVIINKFNCTDTSKCIDFVISDTIACNSFTSPSGKIYSQSGRYFETISSSQGTDSMIYFNLTVNTIDTAISKDKFLLEARLDSADSYQWIDCINNSVITGATSKSYEVTENGRYAVVVSKNNCTDTSRCIEVANVGINEVAAGNKFSISPNPTQGIISLDIQLEDKEEMLIMRNIEGKEVYRKMLNRNMIFPIDIDLEGIKPGIYFITTKSKGAKLIITE